MNRILRCLVVPFFASMLPACAVPDAGSHAARYKALNCPAADRDSTWVVLDRDGAGRQVQPYLSSLGHGEAGTGTITSPPFLIQVKKIGLSLCGHDGQAGGQGKNYIALVDARKGNALLKMAPPQNDLMQEREWDVSGLQGVEVRIEARDGDGGAAFAWMGIGRIDAGEAMRVNFSKGMPTGWSQPVLANDVRYETIAGGIPFKRDANAFTLIPKSGMLEVSCGFKAERLFFLGCVVNSFKPLETHGNIEIHYRDGAPEVFPLMCGFTLDGAYKLLSPSKALYLHPSGDPYQPYLAIKPRNAVIDKLRLVAYPDRLEIPRITAITCETADQSDHLLPLPEARLGTRESTWIQAHSLAAGSPDMAVIIREIRKAHRLPADSGTSSNR